MHQSTQNTNFCDLIDPSQRLTIDEMRPHMEILVFISSKNECLRHTVSHTTAGHPGKMFVFCDNGFYYDNTHTFYKYDKVTKTMLLLDPSLTIRDFT